MQSQPGQRSRCLVLYGVTSSISKRCLYISATSESKHAAAHRVLVEVRRLLVHQALVVALRVVEDEEVVTYRCHLKP